MNRWLSIVITLLFFGGTEIVPVYHNSHCADAPSHQADACTICQAAATVFTVSVFQEPAPVQACCLAVLPPPVRSFTSAPVRLFDAPPTGPPGRFG